MEDKKTQPKVEELLERLVPAETGLDRALYALIGRVSRGDCSPTPKTPKTPKTPVKGRGK